jgi:uncharacterized 2Fe-2S/4Fe-4S cluster protein (DUF4445 family)
MALKFEQSKSVQDYVELGEPMWLTQDRTRLVAKDDPEAFYAYGAAGKRISPEEAKSLGLIKESKESKKSE